MQDHLSEILKTTTVDECWKLHAAKMADYGFERLVYGYTKYRTDSSLGDLEDALVLTNHRADYVEHFINDEAYRHGPMVRWAANNTGWCSWAHIGEMAAEGALTAEEMEVVQTNQRLGVTAGYAISFHDISAKSHGATGLCGPDDATQEDLDQIWNQHSKEIMIAYEIFHMKVIQLPYNTGQRRALTSRQREVLEWAGSGKSIQDTAIIMGLSPATVEKHLRLARATLCVDTTAQAVFKAASQNQFFQLLE